MGLFRVNRPRGFQHNYIYYDPSKEKIAKIEENAKRELGMLPPKEFDPEDIRGKFVEATTHLKRRKESGKKPTHPAILLMLIAVLLWLYYAITSGII